MKPRRSLELASERFVVGGNVLKRKGLKVFTIVAWAKVSGRAVPVDTVMNVLELFDTRYWDFTAKHFWEKLVEDHAFTRSYNWVRLTLQAHGRVRKAPRRGGASPQTIATGSAWHDAAPGRLVPPMGS